MATLENKIILIIGGTAGIGFGVAEASLKSLAGEVVVASSNSQRVANAVERLTNANLGPGKIRGVTVDAGNQDGLKDFIVNFGEVDHIIWTSGEGMKPGTEFPNCDLEVLKGLLGVRLWGPLLVAQNAKFRAGGSFTLTTGTVIFKPIPNFSAVGAVGGSIHTLAKGLAVDLAPIRVNAVAPGAVKTELLRNMFSSEEDYNAALDHLAQKTPVKHIAEPNELAEAYLFVMKCSYITGQTIIVDGGLLLV